MPDYRRGYARVAPFHRQHLSGQTFLTDANARSALREAIGTLPLTHPFVIEALLPDHRHAFWTLPPGDEDFSHRLRVIKRMVAKRV